ncbi:hypothetical protein DL767_008500 [Monosporascus sp. MG133]|nr:hypothetical protein DL767_008500 [Monosporascus sp. MG133]
MWVYPPELTPSEGERLTEVVKDWAVVHGLAVRPPPTVIPSEADPSGILATAVPVTLFPSPFPDVCFNQAVAVQKTYNELYASISQNEDFLAQIVKDLGLFRSDYMVHQDANGSVPQVKQVEFNTIASSFGGLSTQTSLLHKLPTSESASRLAAGIRQAFIEYGPSFTAHEKCVLFLIQGGERNVFDQRHLEYELQKSQDPVIPVFRLPFSEILQHTSIADGAGRQLLYKPPQLPAHTFEVAVIYMRSGYGPSDYPNQSAWEARYHLERSAAIKCPTVLTQVAGTKKVQQVLATPETPSNPPILSRFLPGNSAEISELSSTFTNIYPLDETEAGMKARKIALDPELCKSYVLKPQREGGGNNVYRTAIPEFLKSAPEAHWKSYILMELITPPPVRNVILRNGKLEQGGVICELGIYGTCIWDQQAKTVLHNEQAGYLLRTKGDKSEEGGVAAGFGCMDSVAL